MPRVVARQRRKPAGYATWLAAGILLALVMLAVMTGGVYYLINDSPAPQQTAPDFAATGVFKLTATKEALTQPTLGASDQSGEAAARPTPLPTNTPRPPAGTAGEGAAPNSGALPE